MERTAKQMKGDELYYAVLDFLEPVRTFPPSPLIAYFESQRAERAGFPVSVDQIIDTKKHLSFPDNTTRSYDKINFFDLLEVLGQGKSELIGMLKEAEKESKATDARLEVLPEDGIINNYILYRVSQMQQDPDCGKRATEFLEKYKNAA